MTQIHTNSHLATDKIHEAKVFQLSSSTLVSMTAEVQNPYKLFRKSIRLTLLTTTMQATGF